MKKVISIVFITLFLAPAPYGIAINYQTKECAGYWAGDEFVTYTLPDGWEAYYAGDNGLIQTEIGACQFNSIPNDFGENCCKQLGLTYVSNSLGKERGQEIHHPENYPYPVSRINYLSITVISIGIVVIMVLVYGLYRELKRK